MTDRENSPQELMNMLIEAEFERNRDILIEAMEKARHGDVAIRVKWDDQKKDIVMELVDSNSNGPDVIKYEY